MCRRYSKDTSCPEVLSPARSGGNDKTFPVRRVNLAWSYSFLEKAVMHLRALPGQGWLQPVHDMNEMIVMHPQPLCRKD